MHYVSTLQKDTNGRDKKTKPPGCCKISIHLTNKDINLLLNRIYRSKHNMEFCLEVSRYLNRHLLVSITFKQYSCHIYQSNSEFANTQKCNELLEWREHVYFYAIIQKRRRKKTSHRRGQRPQPSSIFCIPHFIMMWRVC